MSRIPAYRTVYDDLRTKIVEGFYKKGDLLPNETQLDEIYGVSRTTVRKAVEMLVQDGFISVRQGFGTQVINNKTVQNLNCFNSLTETLQRKGYEVGVQGIYIEDTKADAYLSEQFGIDMGTPLVCIYRTHLADGKPVALARNYILRKLVPGIHEKKKEIMSLYRFLKKEYDIVYTLAKDTISACSANYEEAQVLDIDPGEALLTVNRKCYIGDSVCELALVKIIASQHEFEVYTKGDELQ